MSLLDRDIRELIEPWINEQGFANVIYEKAFGWDFGRVDILGISDTLTGIEIKSDSDSFGKRWRTQAANFSACVPFMWLVTTRALFRKSYSRSEYVASDGWGRLLIEEDHSLHVLNEPRHSIRLAPFAVCSAMWKNEVASMLKQTGYWQKGWSRLTRHQLSIELSKIMPIEEIVPYVIRALNKRYPPHEESDG